MNEQQGGFFAWIQAHPMLIALFAVVAVFGIFFLKKNTNTNTSGTASGAQADLSGLATDANGNHIVYEHAADTFINVNKTIGSYNSPVTSSATTTTNPAAAIEQPIEPHIVAPAPIGSLAGTSNSSGTHNGKKDTNSWIYTAPAGSTLTSLAEFAKWGTDYSKLANYRDNEVVLQAAGVDINNPYATVPTGLKLSV